MIFIFYSSLCRTLPLAGQQEGSPGDHILLCFPQFSQIFFQVFSLLPSLIEFYKSDPKISSSWSISNLFHLLFQWIFFYVWIFYIQGWQTHTFLPTEISLGTENLYLPSHWVTAWKWYACAEEGAHLPIAHTLCQPEPSMWKERKKEGRRIMPSLVATTSALACTTCVRMHYVCTNMINVFTGF